MLNSAPKLTMPKERIDPEILKEVEAFAREIFSGDQGQDTKNHFLKRFANKFFDTNLLPPYGRNLFLPTSENLSGLNFKELQALALTAISVLAVACADEVYAKSPEAQVNIKKAQAIIDMIDPITYLSHRNAPNVAASPETKFSEYDLNLLSLNIHREAGGEPTEGKLAVMLTVLERMKSPKYAGTVPGVILKAYQYSWANKLNELEQKFPEKFRDEFQKIKEMIGGLTSVNLEESIQLIKTILETVLTRALNGGKIPDGLVSYHKFGMMKDESYRAKASNNTQRMVNLIEDMHLNGTPEQKAQIILIGNHLFYTQNILDTVSKSMKQ